METAYRVWVCLCVLIWSSRRQLQLVEVAHTVSHQVPRSGKEETPTGKVTGK